MLPRAETAIQTQKVEACGNGDVSRCVSSDNAEKPATLIHSVRCYFRARLPLKLISVTLALQGMMFRQSDIEMLMRHLADTASETRRLWRQDEAEA